MNASILTAIAQCDWYTSSFLVVSQNVFVPLIYYSHLGALIPALLIGFFLYAKTPKEHSVRIFLVGIITFAIWIFGNLVLWATEFPQVTMFFWALLILVEPFIYFFQFYFVYSFVFKKSFSTKQLILFTIPLVPTILLSSTNLGLLGFNLTNCDRAAVEGVLPVYGYMIELMYVLGIIFIGIYGSRKSKNLSEKKSLHFITVGSVLYLLSFSLGNIIEVFTENWSIGLYGLFGAPIFVGLLAYVIVKYKAFTVKLIAAQALVITLWLLIGSLLLVAKSTPTKIVASLTLLLMTILGYFLVRSVKQEVALREQIEGLAVDLQKANDRLKILDKMKSEFVSIASHQLRSPLTSIRGYASMLLEGSYGKLPAKAKEAVERIGDSSRYMALSVEDYLNVSRIEAGNMKYENADFNLKEVTEKVVDEMRPAALKKGLVLVFRSDCNGSCSVHADIGKTRQVILNLVDNAMKYTPKGSITVVAHDDVKKMKMYVSIQDTGVGMSQETIHDVFEKFVRAKNANQINVTGTGLGLFVAKKMVEEMGGRIWAESEGEGKGSIFHFELPLIPGSYRR